MAETDVILSIKAKIEKLNTSDVKNATSDLKKEVEEIKKTTSEAISNLEKSTSDLKNRTEQISQNLAKMGESMAKAMEGVNTGKVVEDMTELESRLDQSVHKAEELEREMDELADTQVPTDEYHKLLEQMAELETALLKVNNKKKEFLEGGGNATSSSFQKMEAETENIHNQMIQVASDMQKLEDEGRDFSLGDATQHYVELIQEAEKTNNEIRKNIEALKAQSAQLKAQAKMKSTILSFYNKWAANVKMLAKGIFDLALRVTNLTKQFAGLITSKVRGGILKLGDAIKSLGQSAGNSNLNIKSLLGTLLKYALSIQALKQGFNMLKGAIADGLGNLVKYKDGMTDIGKAVTGLKNNLTYLKNAWAAAFAPLLTYVIPIINKAIAWLGALAEKVGAFFALLTGKKTMQVAVQNAAGYGENIAKGADKAAKSTDKAAKAQKKWNNELYGWDELNKQQEKDADDSASNIDDKSEEIEDKINAANNMFKDVPVKGILPDWLEEWIEKLKNLWKNGKWFELGQHIADLFNRGLKFLDDWINNTFRPWGVKWAGRIAEILNGFIERLDWKLLGKTFADGINSVFDILNTFLTKFDFEKLGKGIGEAIYSLFDNIDWGLIGRTFANKWNALINFIYGIVSTPGLFQKIGVSIRTMVYAWFNTINWEKTALTLRRAVNGVFDMLESFFGKKSRIPDFINRITKAINLFFNGINWKHNGEVIATALNTIIKSFSNFVNELDWKGIGEGIANFFKSITDGLDTTTLIDALLELRDGIKTALSQIFTTLDINPDDIVQFAQNLANLIADGINGVIHSEWFKAAITSIFTFITTIIGQVDWEGLAKTVMDSLTKAIEAMNADTRDKIVSLFLKILGAAAALTIASSVLEGLFNGIGEVLASGIAKALTGEVAKDVIAGAIQTVLHSSISVGIGGTVLTGASAAGATVAGAIAGGIIGYQLGKNWLSKWLFPNDADLYSEFKLLPGLADAARGIFEGFTGQLDISFSGFIDFLKNELIDQNQLNGIGAGIVEGLAAGWKATWAIVNPIGWFVERFKEIIRGSKDTLDEHSPSAVFKDIGGGIIQGLFNGVKELWQSFKEFIPTKLTELKQKAESKVKEWKTIGTNLVKGFKKGIEESWKDLVSAVKNLLKNFVQGVEDFLGIESPSKVFAGIGNFVSLGLAEGIDDESNSVQAAINDMMENVVDTANKDVQVSPDIEVDTMTTNLDSALDRLATIADKFNIIAEAFNTISNITIPDIAAGKVVPQMALASGGTTTSGGFSEANIQTLVDALTNALYNVGGTASGQDTTQQISINVDGREILNAVVNENNKAIQRTGISPIRV